MHFLFFYEYIISVSCCEKVECVPQQIWFIVLLPRENQGLKYPDTINIINKIIFSFNMPVYYVRLSNNWRQGAKSLFKS
jgi:hypothetical protein